LFTKSLFPSLLKAFTLARNDRYVPEMTVNLAEVDEKLTEVEELLLADIRRVRKMELEETYVTLDGSSHKALKGNTARLKHALEHSGDSHNLSLQTDEHEVLAARIKILTILLIRDLPTGYVHEAHELAVEDRKRFETNVAAKRKQPAKPTAQTTTAKPGFMGSLKGLLKNKETPIEQSRNRLNVSEVETEELDQEAGYLDKGIFSASRELAILADLVETNRHRPPPPPLPRDRASFSARDLSKAPSKTENKLAQTPEDIRRKLQERSATTQAGPSQFQAKDLSTTQVNPSGPVSKSKSEEIARSPEEIRKKLAERGDSAAGKASFASKDIHSEQPPTPTPTAPKFEDAETDTTNQRPAAGRASFTSKDIEPAVPTMPPNKKDNPKPKADDTPKAGRATFESKDLSDSDS